jgi:mRNA-degrading endonuclease RelE of RelBE toxin-antitoxin system
MDPLQVLRNFRIVEIAAGIRVVEYRLILTPGFDRGLKKHLDVDEQNALFKAIAESPGTGPIIPGLPGVRKLRYAIEGRGKRGGARIVYYYRTGRHDVILLDFCAKNEKEDLSSGDKKAINRAVKNIKEAFGIE